MEHKYTPARSIAFRLNGTQLTHSTYATLGLPLFACGRKRGFENG
jgi:hypothetical protein